MATSSENNKRIAKNTLYLYFRMFITMAVGLYTSRVVLNVLGVSDYGLNNVVGGFVSMFGYLNGQLSNGTQRFVTIALGKGDENRLKHIFSACLTIHAIVAVITLILLETFGLWFLNTHLNIDPHRMDAANWVYQFAVFGSFLGIMQVPYMACIMAHEKMSVYAYMSIFDVAMKLLVVALLIFVSADKLILYAFFYFIVNICVIVFYRWYCVTHFSECGFKMSIDKKLYRDIFDYVGWNAIGGFAFMMNGQGINVLLNMFYGTVVNAARGIAFSVSNIVDQFVTNFQVAVNPQTMKYYAQGEIGQMNHLICNNSKYSAFLLMLVGLPIFFETRFLIQLWLGQVPEYVIPFVRLTILQIFIQAMDFPIGSGIHAYGKMKLPNITSSIVYLSVLPVSYVILKYFEATPVATYVVIVCFYPIAMCFDLWILNKYSGFPIKYFLSKVVKTVLVVLFLSLCAPMVVFLTMHDGILRFLLLSCVSVVCSSLVIYQLGLSPHMRMVVLTKIMQKIHPDKFKN